MKIQSVPSQYFPVHLRNEGGFGRCFFPYFIVCGDLDKKRPLLKEENRIRASCANKVSKEQICSYRLQKIFSR